MRLPLFALAAAMIAGAVVIDRTAADLPVHVATHFGLRGDANGWMSRGVYTGVMTGLVIVVPLFALLKIVLLPAAGRGWRGVPHLDYWLAPERRTATRWRLASHAAVLGCLLVAFLVAMHFVLLDANAHAPPALPLQPFLVALVVFLAAVAAWATLVRRTFARAPLR